MSKVFWVIKKIPHIVRDLYYIYLYKIKFFAYPMKDAARSAAEAASAA